MEVASCSTYYKNYNAGRQDGGIEDWLYILE